jgi:MYXO-CTERM domain-containing protein
VPNIQAECAEAAAWENEETPLVSGSGPFTYSLEPFAGDTLPEGMSVDPDTGALTWTPGKQASGIGRYLLRVTSPGGTDLEPAELSVSCGDPLSLGLGCGCNSGVDGASSLLALLALMAAARRVRSRRHADIRPPHDAAP